MAGMAALLSAAETAKSNASNLEIVALEASGADEWGGTSRWSGAHIRNLTSGSGTDLMSDFKSRSGEKTNEALVSTLAENAEGTINWLASKGVEFEKKAANVATGTSLQPRGHGLAIISALRTAAEGLGVKILFGTRAVRLLQDKEGKINGILVRRSSGSGKTYTISCKSVILATGGFGGSHKLLSRYVGPWASKLDVTAPGTKYCQGDGIQMAVQIGAKRSGQYDTFQGKVVDARSRMYDPFLQIVHYGIVVNQKGERFVDEGAPSGEISDFFNYFIRSIGKQSKQIAYLIFNQKILSDLRNSQIPHQSSLIMSDIPPISAQTIDELAEVIRVPEKKLSRTLHAFNLAVDNTKQFDPTKNDGRSTSGISPSKSNWAVEISQPPFLCYPLKGTIQFTFGGITIDQKAEVVSSDSEKPIPGLYAAGEMIGLHYNRYIPGVLILNALVFGRLAGSNSVSYIKDVPQGT